jgi:DNA-binding transcriptional MerR regulator
MNPSSRTFSPAQASAALGVSAKALRLYEQHGLLVPDRTGIGWRAYGASAMAQAAEIVARFAALQVHAASRGQYWESIAPRARAI